MTKVTLASLGITKIFQCCLAILCFFLFFAFMKKSKNQKVSSDRNKDVVFGGGENGETEKFIQTPFLNMTCPSRSVLTCQVCGLSSPMTKTKKSRKRKSQEMEIFKHNCHEPECVNCNQSFDGIRSFNAHLAECNKGRRKPSLDDSQKDECENFNKIYEIRRKNKKLDTVC